MHQPELGDDLERDRVTDQLRRARAELGSQVRCGLRIADLVYGGHVELQDEQGESDGDHGVGQGEQAVHAQRVVAAADGARI
jgi:hypothetical protein